MISITDKLVFAQWTGTLCFSKFQAFVKINLAFLNKNISDKCYYAAKIIKRDPVQTGKWTVVFEDGQTRSLVEEFILPVSLLHKTQSVLVLNENLSEGRPGVVVGHCRNKTTGQVSYCIFILFHEIDFSLFKIRWNI